MATSKYPVEHYSEKDCSDFILKIKNAYKEKPEIAQNLSKLNEEVQNGVINCPLKVIDRIKVIFREQPELMLIFQDFLPHGYVFPGIPIRGIGKSQDLSKKSKENSHLIRLVKGNLVFLLLISFSK